MGDVEAIVARPAALAGFVPGGSPRPSPAPRFHLHRLVSPATRVRLAALLFLESSPPLDLPLLAGLSGGSPTPLPLRGASLGAASDALSLAGSAPVCSPSSSLFLALLEAGTTDPAFSSLSHLSSRDLAVVECFTVLCADAGADSVPSLLVFAASGGWEAALSRLPCLRPGGAVASLLPRGSLRRSLRLAFTS